MSGQISDYIHSPAFYDSVNNDYLDDLDFYMEQCKQVSGMVLELCCGTGRLTIPLAQTGVHIEGLDISSSMLDNAKRKAKEKNLNINFYNQDMINFSLPHKYSLIILPFNSMQCIYSIEKVESLFTNIRKHLLPNGRFIFDVYNPSIELMVERSKQCVEVMRIKEDDKNDILIRESCEYDSALQINRAKWYVNKNGIESIYSLDTRCFFPLELDMLLKYNGYKIENKYGDFSGNIFTSDSMKQICICTASGNFS